MKKVKVLGTHKTGRGREQVVTVLLEDGSTISLDEAHEIHKQGNLSFELLHNGIRQQIVREIVKCEAHYISRFPGERRNMIARADL